MLCRLLIAVGLVLPGLLAADGLAAQTPPAPQTPPAAAADEIWRVIFLGEQRVGYGRSSSRQETRDGAMVQVSDHEEQLALKRFGQQLNIRTRSQCVDSLDGRLLSYSFEMHNPPAQPTLSKGTAAGGKLTIETTIGGRVETRQMDLPADVSSAMWPDLLLRRQPLKPGESRRHRVFLPEFAKVSDVRLDADDVRDVKLHGGGTRKLLKIRVSQSALPGVAMREFIDESGAALRSEADLLGMVTFTVPREVALEEIKGNELDVAVNTLIRVTNPPADVHRMKRITYRVQTPGRNPVDLIPVGPTQAVRPVDVETIELTVTALPVPHNIAAAAKSAELEKYLAATSFLQTGDMRVKEHASRAAAGSQDPGTIAVRMEQYVHRELKKKNFSTVLASAAEVAKSLEGDCTEHACLLAAMLRTQRVPSRIVVGLVYAQRFAAFGGHMWTEAWLDGRWVPLDATIGQGGIGGGHIRVTDSDLADDGPAPVTAFLPLMNLLSRVTIEVTDSVR